MKTQQLVEKTGQILSLALVSFILTLTIITLPNQAHSQTLDKKPSIHLKNKKDCSTDELAESKKLDAQKCREKLNINETDMTKVDAKLADKFGECMLEKMSATCSKE